MQARVGVDRSCAAHALEHLGFAWVDVRQHTVTTTALRGQPTASNGETATSIPAFLEAVLKAVQGHQDRHQESRVELFGDLVFADVAILDGCGSNALVFVRVI